MNLAEKILDNIPMVHDTPEVNDAMREIAWEAWKKCEERNWVGGMEEGYEKNQKDKFNEWYDKQL